MSTLSSLAKGNLKNNKSKSILIAFTIMLTTILLTSVGLTCLNWVKANKEITIERAGSYHSTYKNVTIKELDIIKNNIDIEKFGVLRTVGVAEENENTLAVIYTDENSAEMGNVKFIEGKMPINENEIAVQDGFLKAIGIEAKVGEKLTLKYESRKDEETKSYDFILSGIIETSEFNKANKNYTSIISEEFLKNMEYSDDITFSSYIRVVGDGKLSATEIKDKVKQVAADIGIQEYDVRMNDDYIEAMNPEPEIIVGGIVIALIVILSSILVIYSIFYVSVINKVQEYGKLRAIGATKRQIKNLILREGLVLATISIPVGILIGYLISDFIIVKLVGFSKYDVGGLNLPVIIAVFILCYLTVFLSLIKPMKIASKVSPVEAMRYNGENDGKNNREGYEEVTLKRLTFANIARNKKKTAITLISLSLSGILYITMSTIMASMDARAMATQHGDEDFTLNLTNFELSDDSEMTLAELQVDNPLGKELREELLELDGVKEITTAEAIQGSYMFLDEKQYTTLSSYDEDYIKEIEENLIDGEVNSEILNSGKGIICTNPSLLEEMGIKVGDKINITIMDGAEEINKEFEIVATSYLPGEDFLIPYSVRKDLIKTDITSMVGIKVLSNKLDEVESYLEEITRNNGFIIMTSLEESIKLYEMVLSVTKTLGYSLVIILGVIGFVNLINTMVTSIITRKKELGMLQAIGLSDSQLVKMLQMEGLFYTFGSLGIILTLGNVIGYIAFLVFKNSGASYATYHYPLVQTIIMIVAVTVAQILITYLIASNFRKESLVDRVRYSE